MPQQLNSKKNDVLNVFSTHTSSKVLVILQEDIL